MSKPKSTPARKVRKGGPARKVRKGGPDSRCFVGYTEAEIKKAIAYVGPGPFRGKGLAERINAVWPFDISYYSRWPPGKPISGRAWYNLLAYRWADLYRWAVPLKRHGNGQGTA